MDLWNNTLFQFAIIIVIFLVLTVLGTLIYRKLRNSSNRFLNPKEFLPEEEVHTLMQTGYLILMALCFVNLLYSIIGINSLFYFAVFDIALSLFIAITFGENSRKNKILWFIIVPYGSLSYLLFGESVVMLIDFIHIPIFIYFIKVYYDKFVEYTDSNGLGVTILLLFSIVVISFLITQYVEGVDPLDALVMVSNAFTSNGYAVLGESAAGKVNSLFLVWGGYIISGAGTATLTAAILMRHFNKRFKQLEKLIEEGGNDDDI